MFYREEFLKHHQGLQRQRPYYSESAITDVETALKRIIGQLGDTALEVRQRANLAYPIAHRALLSIADSARRKG